MTSLPLHPLLVHFAVVLVPFTALLLVAFISSKSTRVRLGGWLAGMGVVTAIAARVASSFGEQLLESDGRFEENIGKHDVYGGLAGNIGLLLGLMCVLTWMSYSEKVVGKMPVFANRALAAGIRIVSLIVAIASCILMFLAGHSGAEAVWLR